MIFTPEEIHDAWWKYCNSKTALPFSEKNQGIKNYYIEASKMNNIEDIAKMFYPGIYKYRESERDTFLNI